MNPNQDQNGQQPQYGVNSTPQQSQNGGYDVLPTPSVTGRASGHNPYEFIVANNTKQKKSMIPGGNSFFGKIALFLGAFVVLLIVLAVIFSAVFPDKSVTPELTATAQEQQELVRIASAGSRASSQSLQDASANIQLSVTSDQKKIINYLAARDTELDDKILALGVNGKSDQLLASAKATNTYDATLKEILTDDLVAYQKKLQATYEKATSKTLKADIQSYYNASFLLAQQLKAAETE